MTETATPERKMATAAFAILAATLLIFLTGAAASETGGSVKRTEVPDNRILVEMPAQAQQLMRRDMREHLAALSEILGYLVDGNLEAAAEVAEARLGMSSMGRHRGTGMGPGRFMPLAMRDIGWGMHAAATDFAKVAGNGDQKGSYGALQKVMAACTACHLGYRIR